MKILVSIKRVIDFNIHIRVKSDGSGVETTNIKHSPNPFDAIALEEAIRIKTKNTENNIPTEITAVSIGPQENQETLRYALAMGADTALHILTDKNFEPLNIAKILKSITQKINPDLIILGKQAIDNDCNQTGQMLAGLLNYPQGTFASQLEINLKTHTVAVTREIDGGLEMLELNLPAVITTDLRLNEPRYPSLPNIMKAKQKPIQTITMTDITEDLAAHTEIIAISEPPARKMGTRVGNTRELIQKLKNEAKVL